MVIVSRGYGVRDRRFDGDRKPSGMENILRWNAQRRQYEGVLGVNPDHTLSWAGHSVRFDQLIIANDCQEGWFAQFEPFPTFEELKDLLVEHHLVLDREFSYLELPLNQVEEGIHYVIHLSLRS